MHCQINHDPKGADMFKTCKVFTAYNKLVAIADTSSAEYLAACRAYKERLVIDGGLPDNLAQEYADWPVNPGLILSDFSVF